MAPPGRAAHSPRGRSSYAQPRASRSSSARAVFLSAHSQASPSSRHRRWDARARAAGSRTTGCRSSTAARDLASDSPTSNWQADSRSSQPQAPERVNSPSEGAPVIHSRQELTAPTADEAPKVISVDDINDDIRREVVMAIEMKANNSLGCAYYVMSERRLLLLEDISMATQETIESLLVHVQPTTIIYNNRASETLVDYLEKHASQGGEGEWVVCSCL